MKKIKYAIEIGGSFTKIFVKDEGFALCEPTLISAQPSPTGYQIPESFRFRDFYFYSVLFFAVLPFAA